MKNKRFRDYLKEIDIDADNRHLCQNVDTELHELLLSLIVGGKEKSFSENIKNNVDEADGLSRIFLKRLEYLKDGEIVEDDKFQESVMFFISYFGIDNPGKVIIFLLDILETLYLQDKEVNLKNVLEIYPHGFYNQETFSRIVNEILKNTDTTFTFKHLY